MASDERTSAAAYRPSPEVLRAHESRIDELAKRLDSEVCDHCGHPRTAHQDRFSTHGQVNGLVCAATIYGDGFAYPCACNRNSWKARP